eukprot:6211943-Pleurochrysis_carterae.AAC.1
MRRNGEGKRKTKKVQIVGDHWGEGNPGKGRRWHRPSVSVRRHGGFAAGGLAGQTDDGLADGSDVQQNAHQSIAGEEHDEERGVLPGASRGRRSARAMRLLGLSFGEHLWRRDGQHLLTVTHEGGTLIRRKSPGVTSPSHLPDRTRDGALNDRIRDKDKQGNAQRYNMRHVASVQARLNRALKWPIGDVADKQE